MNTTQLESNIIQSFALAKRDMTKLYDSLYFLMDKVDKLALENKSLAQKLASLSPKSRRTVVRTAKKVATKTLSRKFVAARGSTKMHDSKCPFARNIKPKNKVVLKSKVTALNQGFKLCSCLH